VVSSQGRVSPEVPGFYFINGYWIPADVYRTLPLANPSPRLDSSARQSNNPVVSDEGKSPEMPGFSDSEDYRLFEENERGNQGRNRVVIDQGNVTPEMPDLSSEHKDEEDDKKNSQGGSGSTPSSGNGSQVTPK